MSKIRGKLAKVAQQRGQTVEETVRAAVVEAGTLAGAAAALGVAPNAVSVWMRSNGYRVKRVVRSELVKVVQNA